MGNCTGLCSNNQVSKTICKEEDLAIEECLSSTHEVQNLQPLPEIKIGQLFQPEQFAVQICEQSISDQQSQRLCNNDQSTYTFPNNIKYTGQWNNGLRDGFGVQEWPDGSVYTGQWKEDQCHGQGKLVHKDKDIYEGNWEENKANGFGIYKNINGAVKKTRVIGDLKSIMRVIGKMTSNTGTAKKYTQTDPNMKESTRMGKSMEKEK